MTRTFWNLKKDLDPLKCLVFPKEEGMSFEEDELDSSGQIDLELFNEIVDVSPKLDDAGREHIVSQIKNGYTMGEYEA